MTSLWLVHREERTRHIWADRLGQPLASGDPADLRAFATAEVPAVVVLGFAGDGEAELEFAHRHAARLPETSWLVVAPPEALGEAQRLFDSLPAVFLPASAGAAVLQRQVAALASRRQAPPLSERQRRDRLRERFVRWFGDLDLPEVLQATDPKRVEVPFWVRGEPGTGRGLLARYVHWVGSGPPPGPFVALPCAGIERIEALADRAIIETGRLPGGHHVTLCLEGLDRLDPVAQRALRRWLEDGPPAGLARAPRMRWMVVSDERYDDALDPDLVEALAGFACRIPPVAERAGAFDPFIANTARAWCRDRGERERVFAADAVEALRGRPWRGNLRQLEAVLVRSLAASGSTAIPASELRVAAPGGLGVPGQPLGEVSTSLSFRRLAAAVSREASAPLSGIRTLARMLPRRYQDPTYRDQLMERVEAEASRIQTVLDTLAQLAALPAPAPTRVNVSALLSGLLELRRVEIDERRMIVLEELDRLHPYAWADRDQLRLALETLVEAALDWLDESGEIALTTDTVSAADSSAEDHPRLRVRLRLRQPSGTPAPRVEGSLATSIAELVIRAQGGDFRQGPLADGEVLLEFELPASPR